MDNLLKQIQTCSNEKYLKIYVSEEKGRGIKTKKSFAKGEFIVEYKGLQIFFIGFFTKGAEPGQGSYRDFSEFLSKNIDFS